MTSSEPERAVGREVRRVFPVYVVIDTSSSMHSAIEAANTGLLDLIASTQRSPLIDDRVLLSIIGFADRVTSYLELGRASDVVSTPRLTSGGGTSYRAVFDYLAEQVVADRQRLRASGVWVSRPAIFFFTDGLPTDDWTESRRALQDQANPTVLAFSTADVDASVLREVASDPRYVYRSDEADTAFDAVSSFLLATTMSVVQSTAGDAGPGLVIPDLWEYEPPENDGTDRGADGDIW